jgi:hypothetical protein
MAIRRIAPVCVWPVKLRPRNLHKKKLQRALATAEGSGLPAVIAARNFHAYLLENEADLTEVLRIAISSGGG